jgi:hypothetical protein
VPYALSGNAWIHPELITISFEPDGTNLGGVSSNLFAAFDRKFGSASVWQAQILKAAQTWAQYSDLNFAIVSDNGAASGSGSYQQGDPNMGDIRIGGYNEGGGSLALTYLPAPSNNYSISGDMAFNTSKTFNIGSTYDLYTVAMHEFGHALGLLHSTLSGAVMYGTYTNAKSGLASDDIQGVRAIYSLGNARSMDQYGDCNSSFSAAADVTSQINTSNDTALLTGLSLDNNANTGSATQSYFKFTAPSGCSSTLTVTMQSQGLSLLSPDVWVYDANQSLLGSASTTVRGATITVTVSGITAGSTYYVEAGAADTSVFSIGSYAITLNMGTGGSPTVPLPNTQTLNGSPLSGSGGIANNVINPAYYYNLLGLPNSDTLSLFDDGAVTGRGHSNSHGSSSGEKHGRSAEAQSRAHRVDAVFNFLALGLNVNGLNSSKRDVQVNNDFALEVSKFFAEAGR